MRILKTLILFFLLVPLSVHSQTSADIEIVESIPVVTTLDNPDIRDTYPVWIEMITGAKHSLDIEQFYISNATGSLFENVLIEISLRHIGV